MGSYCHTHNYSSLPIQYVDRDRFEKNYVDRAGRRRRGERTKAEDKVLSPMCWAGLDILIEKLKWTETIYDVDYDLHGSAGCRKKMLGERRLVAIFAEE